MDFVSYIRNQSEKLNSREYVAALWDELDSANETSEASMDVDAITDFNNHLPLVLEQFWEIALEKLDEDVDEIDDHLKRYLLVLIYHCTTHSQESGHSHASIMYASEVYMHLLTTTLSEEMFNGKLYRLVLSTLQASIESNSCRASSRRLLQKMKGFMKKSRLVTGDLEVTLATLLHIIFTKSGRVHDPNFDTELVPESESLNAFLCLKVLQLKETVPARKLMITLFMFNGLRRCSSIHLTLQTMSILQVNFRNLLRSLKEKFKEDNYKSFMNAFIHVWRHADFTYCGEAVLIMNDLEEAHYKTLTDVLNKMITSQPNKNLFRLSLAIVCNPPAHAHIEKVKVSNQILLRGILMNCLSPKSEICNAAVEAFGEILISPDSQKEFVDLPLRHLLSSSEGNLLRIPTVLRGLKTLMNKKWSSKSRNKPLFGIVVSLMLISDQDHFDVCHEVLDLLSEEASPHDLKPFLPLLSEAYLKLTANGRAGSAMQILRVLFKMALHPMTTSGDFVKFLYSAMVCPAVCKGVVVRDSQIFIDPIISNDYNFVEFFQKCHTLGLIRLHVISPLHVTAETGSGQCPTETEGQHSVNVDVNSESGNRVTAAAEAHYVTTTKSLSSQLDVPATSLKSTTTGTPPTSPIDLEYTFISKEEYDSVMAHDLEIERVPRETNTVIEGNRTVQLGYVLDWALRLQSEHSAKCTLGKMQVVEEVTRGLGLVSEIVLKCDSCGFETRKRTEDPKLLPSHLNYGAVWGTLSTGSTYSQMVEQHSCMNIPCMPYNKFHAIELELGDSWKDSLWSTMEAAGKEEYERAVEKGQFDSDGNVWITVYVDGGWSHRSYGHNYNAASGASQRQSSTFPQPKTTTAAEPYLHCRL